MKKLHNKLLVYSIVTLRQCPLVLTVDRDTLSVVDLLSLFNIVFIFIFVPFSSEQMIKCI